MPDPYLSPDVPVLRNKLEIKNEKTLDVEEMTDLVYRFSREVEHSDMNLKHVEKIMEKKWFLREDAKDGIQ